MKKINEIFYSLQGEGYHTGVPSVFIRFSGCNLKCGFCDTRHEEGSWMKEEEIFDEVKKYPAKLVVLTGGEPSLHIDEDFIKRLKESTGKTIAIETNGTHELPEGIDWITLSPKLGMSPTGEASVKLKKADEIKVVDLGQELESYFELPCRRPSTLMYLQPCYVVDEEQRQKNTRQTVERVLKDPRWRLSLQIHRVLDIP